MSRGASSRWASTVLVGVLSVLLLAPMLESRRDGIGAAPPSLRHRRALHQLSGGLTGGLTGAPAPDATNGLGPDGTAPTSSTLPPAFPTPPPRPPAARGLLNGLTASYSLILYGASAYDSLVLPPSPPRRKSPQSHSPDGTDNTDPPPASPPPPMPDTFANMTLGLPDGQRWPGGSFINAPYSLTLMYPHAVFATNVTVYGKFVRPLFPTESIVTVDYLAPGSDPGNLIAGAPRTGPTITQSFQRPPPTPFATLRFTTPAPSLASVDAIQLFGILDPAQAAYSSCDPFSGLMAQWAGAATTNPTPTAPSAAPTPAGAVPGVPGPASNLLNRPDGRFWQAAATSFALASLNLTYPTPVAPAYLLLYGAFGPKAAVTIEARPAAPCENYADCPIDLSPVQLFSGIIPAPPLRSPLLRWYPIPLPAGAVYTTNMLTVSSPNPQALALDAVMLVGYPYNKNCTLQPPAYTPPDPSGGAITVDPTAASGISSPTTASPTLIAQWATAITYNTPPGPRPATPLPNPLSPPANALAAPDASAFVLPPSSPTARSYLTAIFPSAVTPVVIAIRCRTTVPSGIVTVSVINTFNQTSFITALQFPATSPTFGWFNVSVTPYIPPKNISRIVIAPSPAEGWQTDAVQMVGYLIPIVNTSAAGGTASLGGGNATTGGGQHKSSGIKVAGSKQIGIVVVVAAVAAGLVCCLLACWAFKAVGRIVALRAAGHRKFGSDTGSPRALSPSDPHFLGGSHDKLPPSAAVIGITSSTSSGGSPGGAKDAPILAARPEGVPNPMHSGRHSSGTMNGLGAPVPRLMPVPGDDERRQQMLLDQEIANVLSPRNSFDARRLRAAVERYERSASRESYTSRSRSRQEVLLSPRSPRGTNYYSADVGIISPRPQSRSHSRSHSRNENLLSPRDQGPTRASSRTEARSRPTSPASSAFSPRTSPSPAPGVIPAFSPRPGAIPGFAPSASGRTSRQDDGRASRQDVLSPRDTGPASGRTSRQEDGRRSRQDGVTPRESSRSRTSHIGATTPTPNPTDAVAAAAISLRSSIPGFVPRTSATPPDATPTSAAARPRAPPLTSPAPVVTTVTVINPLQAAGPGPVTGTIDATNPLQASILSALPPPPITRRAAESARTPIRPIRIPKSAIKGSDTLSPTNACTGMFCLSPFRGPTPYEGLDALPPPPGAAATGAPPTAGAPTNPSATPDPSTPSNAPSDAGSTFPTPPRRTHAAVIIDPPRDHRLAPLSPQAHATIDTDKAAVLSPRLAPARPPARAQLLQSASRPSPADLVCAQLSQERDSLSQLTSYLQQRKAESSAPTTPTTAAAMAAPVPNASPWKVYEGLDNGATAAAAAVRDDGVIDSVRSPTAQDAQRPSLGWGAFKGQAAGQAELVAAQWATMSSPQKAQLLQQLEAQQRWTELQLEQLQKLRVPSASAVAAGDTAAAGAPAPAAAAAAAAAGEEELQLPQRRLSLTKMVTLAAVSTGTPAAAAGDAK